MHRRSALALKVLLTTVTGALGIALVSTGATAGASQAEAGVGGGWHSPPPFQVTQILLGTSLSHRFIPEGSTVPMTEPLHNPDDITRLGNDLFVGFQNGVGPQGQPSTDGNLDSTVVELSLSGRPLGQWDVAGKTDGVTADPALGGVIATVNEDANSALYVIEPGFPWSMGPGFPSPAGTVTRYTYNEPLPHDGGTDAISVENGQLFISASAPGTTGAAAPQPIYPAVYSVRLDPRTRVATVSPLFFDEDPATVANVNSPDFGNSTQLALTDPDSNEVVPGSSPRFGGDFVLTSQGDLQQIYVSGAGTPHQRLAVLTLSQSVDDTAWPTYQPGALYSTDSTNDSVDTVTGPFRADQPLVVATPCGANSAPAICPSLPLYPANYLATLDLWTGQVTPLALQGAPYVPQGGLAFVSAYSL
jgi:hypothetical protein